MAISMLAHSIIYSYATHVCQNCHVNAPHRTDACMVSDLPDSTVQLLAEALQRRMIVPEMAQMPPMVAAM